MGVPAPTKRLWFKGGLSPGRECGICIQQSRAMDVILCSLSIALNFARPTSWPDSAEKHCPPAPRAPSILVFCLKVQTMGWTDLPQV